MEDQEYQQLRRQMVQIIAAYAVHAGGETGRHSLDGRVLEAMARVPRQEFVPYELRPYAYFDGPLPIGFEKTISQPFIVALMTDLLKVRRGDRVLEVGTGLGYHAALLAELGARVFTVEIVEELAEQAGENLERAGYADFEARIGDGSRGWIEHAPFDRILVCAAPELIPSALIAQLAPGGVMVVPAGVPGTQQLMRLDKDAAGKVSTREVLAVSFSPLEVSH